MNRMVNIAARGRAGAALLALALTDIGKTTRDAPATPCGKTPCGGEGRRPEGASSRGTAVLRSLRVVPALIYYSPIY